MDANDLKDYLKGKLASQFTTLPFPFITGYVNKEDLEGITDIDGLGDTFDRLYAELGELSESLLASNGGLLQNQNGTLNQNPQIMNTTTNQQDILSSNKQLVKELPSFDPDNSSLDCYDFVELMDSFASEFSLDFTTYYRLFRMKVDDKCKLWLNRAGEELKEEQKTPDGTVKTVFREDVKPIFIANFFTEYDHCEVSDLEFKYYNWKQQSTSPVEHYNTLYGMRNRALARGCLDLPELSFQFRNSLSTELREWLVTSGKWSLSCTELREAAQGQFMRNKAKSHTSIKPRKGPNFSLNQASGSSERKWCEHHQTATHNTSDCRYLQAKKAWANPSHSKNKVSGDDQKEDMSFISSDTKCLHLDVEIEGDTFSAVVDTGGSRSLITSTLCHRLGIDVSKFEGSTKLIGPSDDEIKIKGACNIDLFILPTLRDITAQFLVVDSEVERLLIGVDNFHLLRGLSIDLGTKLITLTQSEPDCGNPSTCELQALSSEEHLQPESQEEPWEELSYPSNVVDPNPPSDHDLNSIFSIQEEVDNLCATHPLFEEFRDCFTLTPDTPAPSSVPPYVIRVKDPDVFPYQKARPIPEHFLPDWLEMKQKLINAGIFTLGTSPCQAPIFMKWKKSGTGKKLQMIADFRNTNTNLLFDPFPADECEGILFRFAHFTYFIILDLASGFYQIRIADESKKWTCISDGIDQLLANVLVFGLNCAPAALKQAMRFVFGDIIGDSIEILMDDLIIGAHSEEDALEKLRLVLERARENNLSFKASKVQFMETKVNFLGYRLENGGIHPTNEKIEALDNLLHVNSLTDLRRFYGLANYMSKLIPKWGEISKPISDVMDSRKYVWGDPQKQAANHIISILQSSPCIQGVQPHQTYLIESDASKLGVGGVLCQVNVDPTIANEDRDTWLSNCMELYQSQQVSTVAYYSRPFTSSEENLSPTELELCGVIYVMRRFQKWIYGAPFVVVTDHKALPELWSSLRPSGRPGRWVQDVQEFGPALVYIPGETNVRADALSRVGIAHSIEDPLPNELMAIVLEEMGTHSVDSVLEFEEEGEEETKQGDVQALHRGYMIQLQRDDLELSPLIEFLETNNCKDEDRDSIVGRTASMKIEDELLMTTDNKILVPDSLKIYLTYLYHDSVFGGHQGETSTLESISRRYQWKGMNKEIKQLVKNCEICINRRVKQTDRFPFTSIVTHIIPFYMICIDYLGPFGEEPTSQGNRYILTLIDYATSFPVCFPTKTMTAEELAPKILRVFCEHGFPKVIVSDRGTTFLSEIILGILAIMGTEKRNSTPFNPRTGGKAENFNRTIIRMQQPFVHQFGLKWDTALDLLQYAYRSTPNPKTGFSPFFLRYGFTPTHPFERDLAGNRPFTSLGEYAQVTFHNLRRVWKLVAEKKFTDRENTRLQDPPSYEVGSQVLVFDPNSKKTKLDTEWIGPVSVVRKVSDYNYEVDFGNSRKSRIRNAWNLRPFMEPRDPPIPPVIPTASSNSSATSRAGRNLRHPERYQP